MERAVHTHVITARHAAPLMVEANRGLIVEITDGDSFGYRGNLAYDLAKHAVIRLAFGMAWKLRRDGVKASPHFIASETPLFVGRAVAALAADPTVRERAGRVFASWTLSDQYGFADGDGARLHWGRYAAQAFGTPLSVADEAAYASWHGGIADAYFKDWP